MRLLPALLLCAAAISCRKPEKKPNILLVTLDTTRADALGSYGNQAGTTPRLDALAAAGARFDRAYTVTPLTIPAHSSLFTGLYPPRHGVRDNGDFFLAGSAVTLAERLREGGYETAAAVGAEVTSHHWGFSQGFDAFFDEMERDQANRWRVERRGDAVLADGLGWLAQRSGEKPWFLWLHLFDAHHPYQAPPPFDAQGSHPYLREVAYVDSLVGQALDALEQREDLDDTWVVVLADHGEGLGDHGEAMHGVLLYNATTRIPLLVRPPGGLDGRVLGFPASIVDVAPTLLAAAGLPAAEGVDGRDLTPWLAASPAAEPPERGVYLESLYAWHHYGWAPQRALVEGEHKLIASTTPELYARADARERSDLAGQDAALLADMQGRLSALEAAMTPSESAPDRAALSAERLAQLEALGYMTATNAGQEPTADLPDPVKKLPLLRRVEQARAALQAGDLPGARQAIEAVLQDQPELVDPRLMLASILWQQGDLAAAEAAIEEVRRRQPGGSQPLAMLGTLRLQRGDLEGGMELLEESLRIDPYVASAWLPLLHALYLSGDIARLEETLPRARAALPDAPEIRGMEGMVLAMQGDPSARAVLEQAVAAAPSQPIFRFGLGVIARQEGRTDDAETLLLEEVLRHPPALPARKILVEIYAEQRRYEEQLAQLDAILAAGPPAALDHHSRAQALYNLKRYPEAKTSVEACIQANPAYPACAMLEANILKKLGQEEAANAAYQRALRLAEAVQGQPQR